MEVILLEKIANLGELGDKVSVKPGFARNYLAPKGKAKPATAENLEEFEARRVELEALEAERLQSATERADKIADKTLVVRHQAGEGGRLFGSVTNNEIAHAISSEFTEVSKSEIRMPEGPIRTLGEYTVQVVVHSDVTVGLRIIVEPSE